MKAFFVFMILAFMAMSFAPPLPAPADKYPYGLRKAVTLTSATAITIPTENLTLTLAALPIAHNATVTATVTKSVVGDRIILKVTADGTNRHLDFTGNLTAPDDSVVANKTKLFEFIYDGSKFVQLGELQIN
jgi:hypothetical protein